MHRPAFLASTSVALAGTAFAQGTNAPLPSPPASPGLDPWPAPLSPEERRRRRAERRAAGLNGDTGARRPRWLDRDFA